MQKSERKIAFMHGRPHGHPLHAAYAHSIFADFYHEDRYLRWHDKPKAIRLIRYLSWIINGLFSPVRKYDTIVTECIRIPALILKKVYRSKKLIAIMGDESLYFLSIMRYPRLTSWLMKKFLNSCDYLICTSKFQAELAYGIIDSPNHKIITVFNGIDIDEINYEKPLLNGFKILFIGNIEADWRAWYKGLDLALEVFEELKQTNKEIEFHVIGKINDEVKDYLSTFLNDKSIVDEILFYGHSEDLLGDIKKFDLVLHIARGEAWGLTIHIAMAAGVPVVISENTGIKELVEHVDTRLIVPLKKREVLRTMNWYFNLSSEEKINLSDACRNIAIQYTKVRAIENFRKEVKSLI